jgi:hypothetical protein
MKSSWDIAVLEEDHSFREGKSFPFAHEAS